MDERTPGRRSKWVQLKFMLPEGDRQAVIDIAGKRGVRAADLFRRAVSNFVEAHRRTQRRERARAR